MALEPEQAARYVRQIMLPEVGVAGQERICATCAVVGVQRSGGAALQRWVTERYLRRAGVAEVVAEGPAEDDAGALVSVSYPAARHVLLGARAALQILRRALPAVEEP